MKFPKVVIVMASIVCKTRASGYLRSSREGKNSDPSDDQEGGYLVEASVHMKGQPDSRTLEESDETLASELHNQQKLEATLKKQEKVKPLGDEATIPTYVLYPKEDSTNENSDAEPISDFDVNIVGGDISDANEFPYFGTLPMHLTLSVSSSRLHSLERGDDSSLTCRSCS